MPQSSELDGTGRHRMIESQFGEITYDHTDVIRFPDGLFGYDQYKRYLVWEDEQYRPFRWLICLENPTLIFPVVDPMLICPDYRTHLNDVNGATTVLAIVTIGESIDRVTANLRAPVVIEEESRTGKQLILMNTNLSLRYRIVSQPSG